MMLSANAALSFGDADDHGCATARAVSDVIVAVKQQGRLCCVDNGTDAVAVPVGGRQLAREKACGVRPGMQTPAGASYETMTSTTPAAIAAVMSPSVRCSSGH